MYENAVRNAPDWQKFAAVRESFAAELTSGAATTTFVEPLAADGYPITGRMIDALSSCETAITLAPPHSRANASPSR